MKEFKKKIVNCLWCALLGIVFGLACGLCIAICENDALSKPENLAYIGMIALIWGFLLPSFCRCQVKDALKSFSISIAIVIIAGLLYHTNLNASFRFLLLLMSTVLVPVPIILIFRMKSDEKARNESPEMQLSKKVANWYSKYLIESSMDEKTVSNFNGCLTRILYSHHNDESYILATGYGDLQRLEKDFKLSKGIFPDNLVMFILFKENKAYYNYKLSSPEIEL